MILPYGCAGLAWLQSGSKLSGALLWQGRKRKESLQLHLWNLNICIEKVNTKCWLAYICASFHFALIGGNLTAQSIGSHMGIGGRIKFNCLFLIFQCVTWLQIFHNETKICKAEVTLSSPSMNLQTLNIICYIYYLL